MRVKSVVSVLAMTAAMIAAPAFAQEAAATATMMGGVEVSEADRAAVQARCDVLVADDDSTVSDVNTSSSVTTDTETGSDDEDSWLPTPAATTPRRLKASRPRPRSTSKASRSTNALKAVGLPRVRCSNRISA
ncbi:hypothetical protein [Devosia aurantiaca]|uniref:Uncharacterized protein n=1 Tax=Devosia aurantiaca TaxID=2714858 RepID=A0A6M1SRT3_9HYPH|nr:hypothetical protein [Devosia aurantiaca]NGP18092.1 hypothetical protein [Devosia aurantiaca]